MTKPNQLTLDEFAAATYEEWRAAAEESLKGAPFEKKLITRTHEGIELQPIYNASDLDASEMPESWPGIAPYTRGASPAGHSIEPWLVAQEIPAGLPSDFNKALREDLNRGQNAVMLLLDSATRRCADPETTGGAHVAVCGVSIATLDDLADALENVSLEAVPLMVWAGASSVPMAGMLQALASKRGEDLRQWKGAVLADPLTEAARDGGPQIPFEKACKEMAAGVRWAEESAPGFRTVGIQASLWGDAGANAVQELAFAMATAAEYVRQLGRQGIAPDAAARRTAFGFSTGSQIFMEIAKLRAARLLWSNVQKAFGIDPVPMFLHTRGSLFNKSVLDIHTNMLRATAEGVAGALGGADSMHIAAFDETAREPDSFARRIARNVHIILAEECGFAEIADPAGGSWYIETLTAELAKKAWAHFQEIEGKGGMANAVFSGTAQVETAKSAEAKLGAAASRRDGYIGVNLFPNVAEELIAAPKVDLKAVRAARGAAATAARAAFGEVSKIGGSVAEAAGLASRGATIGQIRYALSPAAAAPATIARLRTRRAAEPFEELRAAALAYKAAHGTLPKIWLANFGPVKQYKARADFSSGFLTPGSFDVAQGPGAKTPEEAAEAALAAQPLAVVLCSTDDTYPEIVPAFVKAFRAKNQSTKIILAGYPQEQAEALKEAGVQFFIHIRLNCLEFNRELHEALAIS